MEGEADALDVTAFTLATLFRTVPVDEWYNQRSRGTPVLKETVEESKTRNENPSHPTH